MLEVEQQLETVRGDIESMESRIEYINNHVSYATVTIIYFQVVVVDNEETFGQKVASSLNGGWSALLGFVVAILAAWPLLIVGSVVFWIAARLVKKYKMLPAPVVTKII